VPKLSVIVIKGIFSPLSVLHFTKFHHLMLSDCGYLNILSAIGVGEKEKEQ
jgi:hypothetical protein